MVLSLHVRLGSVGGATAAGGGSHGSPGCCNGSTCLEGMWDRDRRGMRGESGTARGLCTLCRGGSFQAPVATRISGSIVVFWFLTT